MYKVLHKSLSRELCCLQKQEDEISESAILSVSQSVNLTLVTSLTVSYKHIASEIQVPHCVYKVGNDKTWGENDTVQPFTAVMPMTWHDQRGHYRLISVNRLTVKCPLH